MVKYISPKQDKKEMKLQAKNFNLQHTLESGQFFRYQKIGEWYYCCERDKIFKIKQQEDEIEFEGTTKEHVEQLFGLDKNYDEILKKLSEDKTLKEAVKKYNGLRIMKRDPWETLISFQCSIMSNIKKIQLNMNKLAEAFGKPMVLDRITMHSFPSPGEINDLQKIKNCATGFRAKYIHAANNIVDDKKMEKWGELEYEKLIEELDKIPGVARKVADCVALFGYGRGEAFPIDVWMERAMKPYTYKTKHDEIRKIAIEKWGKHAGYAQQFLYHNIRNTK